MVSAGGPYSTHAFTFDHVYDVSASQKKVPVLQTSLLNVSISITLAPRVLLLPQRYPRLCHIVQQRRGKPRDLKTLSLLHGKRHSPPAIKGLRGSP